MRLTIDYRGGFGGLGPGPSSPNDAAAFDGSWYAFETADSDIKPELFWSLMLVFPVYLALQFGKHGAD